MSDKDQEKFDNPYVPDVTNDTTIKKAQFVETYWSNAGNISMACKAILIARKTFYRWMEEDAYFKECINEVNEALIDFSESALMSAIKDKNITAIIFHLKTKGKHRGYVEKQEVVVPDGINIKNNDTELLKEMVNALKYTQQSNNNTDGTVTEATGGSQDTGETVVQE